MKGRSLKQVLLILLPGLPILGLVVAARLLGFFQLIELQTLDLGLRARPHEAPDRRITIVGITEEDIQTIGAYPIPDGEIAALIQTINQHKPRAVGLDIFRDLPVKPGYPEFTALMGQLNNLVVINKILPPAVSPPAAASELAVGFVDALPDNDGFVRRSLLGATDAQNEYRFSFTIRLAEHYLAAEGLSLENGIRDPQTMRFADTELIKFRSNTGGFVRADANGEQILINFRSGSAPFETVDYQTVRSGEFDADIFADRIVLIGVTAPSIKDIINTAAVGGVNPGLVTGVEVQAHAISQILSAVMDDRPLLEAWPDGIEYLWIVGWGIIGILLARCNIKPPYFFVTIVALSIGLAAISYGALLASWWIPAVPAVVAFLLSGVVLYPSFRAQQALRLRLQDRQQLIERTFDQIHNGPLQKLSTVLARVSGDPRFPTEVDRDLRSLNHELRDIYESLRQEFLTEKSGLRLAGGLMISLDQPLHEVLYEIYDYTLQRKEFPYLPNIKVHLRKFEPMDEQGLSLDRKREIGRFLEEAICNVGKYAKGSTRLTVICMQEESMEQQNIVQVIDNGIATNEESGLRRIGRGTQQAVALAKQLNGRFERTQHLPKGTISELRWPT